MNYYTLVYINCCVRATWCNISFFLPKIVPNRKSVQIPITPTNNNQKPSRIKLKWGAPLKSPHYNQKTLVKGGKRNSEPRNVTRNARNFVTMQHFIPALPPYESKLYHVVNKSCILLVRKWIYVVKCGSPESSSKVERVPEKIGTSGFSRDGSGRRGWRGKKR